MVGEKLKQLAEQIDFLINLEQEALGECIQEVGSLIVSLERESSRLQDEEVNAGLDLIKKTVSEDYEKMRHDFTEELNFLQKQREIIGQALSVKSQDIDKFAEIEKLILEDVGDLEDNETFKQRMQNINAQNRTELLNVITDIKEALAEGAIEDLAAFFEASALENAEEKYSEEDDADSEEESLEEKEDSDESDECCDKEDLGVDFTENEKLMEILKQYSEPYFVEKTK